MISFKNFTDRLASGQLKGTNAVDEDVNMGEICPDYIKKILSLTNEGLVDLSTRFPLIKKQVDLTFLPDQHLYPMLESGLTEGYLSLVDDTSFNENDFIKVLDIWDEYGDSIPHNTEGHIVTPTYNTLRFTSHIMDCLKPKVRIRYQAKHSSILETDNIDIPPNLESALQLFVASLFFSHMNGDNSKNGDKYYGAYLRHVGEDELKDTSSTSEVDEDSRFQDKGFV